MYRRVTLQKNASRAAVYYKKALAGHNLQEKLSNQAVFYQKFIKKFSVFEMLECLRPLP